MSLEEMFRSGAARWPEVPLAASDFVRLLTERAAELDETLAPDLFLACACTLSIPQALQAFDESYLSQVGKFVARVDPSPAFADEVRQHLRNYLLVAEAGPPRIAGYAGRGPLGAWLRVAAVRAALKLVRAERANVDMDLTLFAAAGDYELAFLKEHHKQDFRAAFADAMAALTVEARHFMRLHYVDGLSVSQIAALEHLDKSTVSRRLTQYRLLVADETRRLLAARLQLSPSEADSLAAAVQSQIEITLERLLG